MKKQESSKFRPKVRKKLKRHVKHVNKHRKQKAYNRQGR